MCEHQKVKNFALKILSHPQIFLCFQGLFARRRMLLLTQGPHLYYVDPVNMILKGEIPWSQELRVEPKNFKIFFVHTVSIFYCVLHVMQ